MTTFCKNLKRLRLAKKLTQEQVAETLGVSAQTVSRWECGTTLPDVAVLPKIAEVYCVSIDDLYKETSVAYANPAQKLASIYCTTWTAEDFARADQEFRKLQRNGAATTEDLRQYGILHQYMMRYCMVKAEELFNEVLNTASGDIYWRTRRQKLYFQTLIGRCQESISTQLALIENGCEDFQEWVCLIAAFQYSGECNQAYEWFRKAVRKFPDKAMLYVYGGDICNDLGCTEEAFRYWDKALELDSTLCDAKHSKAYCYETLGEHGKAYALWWDIAEELAKKEFDVEAARSRERAERCRQRTGL